MRSIARMIGDERRLSLRHRARQPRGRQPPVEDALADLADGPLGAIIGTSTEESPPRPEVIRMANVNVTYQEMHSAAQRLTSGQTEITDKLNELQKLVNGLVNGGYVTDSSSKNFEAAFQEFNRGAQGVIGGLHQMSSYLTKAATTFQNADQELANSLHKH
jgi:WXG100 family type VII secretion target